MKVVAVVNEKGGVGKTTIATHLARGLQLAGKAVLLVDADPQGSCRDWYAAAGEGNDLPPVVGLDRPELFGTLPRVASGCDWVVVDGSPRVEAMTVAALKCADFAIIPIQPSPYDVWAAESLVEMVKTRQSLAGSPQAAFLANRCIAGTKLAADVREAIGGYGLPVMEASIAQRVIFSSSAAVGSSAMDAEPGGAGAAEIRKLVEEVLLWERRGLVVSYD